MIYFLGFLWLGVAGLIAWMIVCVLHIIEQMRRS